MATPLEMPDLEYLNLGKVNDLKYQISELCGADAAIVSGTWKLYADDESTHATLQSGTLIVDNADLDAAGNTVSSVQVTIDLTGSSARKGYFWLCLDITFNSANDSQVFRVPVEILDYRSEE